VSLERKNSNSLIDPKNLKLKILIAGLPGAGKTSFVGTIPNCIVAACETGHGAGLLSVAERNIDYVEPSSYQELESFCSGDVAKDKEALAIDSLSAMTRTFIKNYAITNFPRSRGETPKRRAGIPELDDYGTIGECTRRLLAKLLALPKHIVVTATLRLPEAADPETGREAKPAAPDLPGQLALASAAMFDTVLILRTRPALRDARDAKSRYTQRYWLTQGNEQWVAKSRLNAQGAPLLAEEEVFDLQTGQGSFPYLLEKVLRGYTSCSPWGSGQKR